MRSSVFAVILAAFSGFGAADVSFVVPPRSVPTNELDKNPVYLVGAKLRIEWAGTEGNSQPLSLVLIPSGFMGNVWDKYLDEQETILDNLVGVTSATWIVKSTKNRDPVHTQYYLVVGPQGETSGLAASHWFNMTNNLAVVNQPQAATQTVAPPTSSSPLSSSPASSRATDTLSLGTSVSMSPSASASGLGSGSTSDSTARLALGPTQDLALVPTSASTGASTSASTPVSTLAPAAASDGGLSTAAKIGLAVGIVAALVLGVAGGWFWSAWRKNGRRPRGNDAAELGGSEKIPPPRAGAHEADGRERPSELNAVPRLYELTGAGAHGVGGRGRPSELDAAPRFFELSGS